MKKIFTAVLLGATLLTGSALASPQRVDPLASADTDQDGAITRTEMLAEADARFTKLDANKDGKVAKDERLGDGGGPGGRLVGRMMNRVDTDGDGAISLAEHRAQAAKRFERLDANSDGKIDQAERENARERLREMRERRGGAE